MPSNARDRLACTYELIYVLTKQSAYFFDLDAIRIPHRSTPARGSQMAPRGKESWRGPNGVIAGGLDVLKREGRIGHPLGKNPGDVWSLPTSNFRGAHHATFPLNLATRAIQAGCPEVRCEECRRPWRRQVVRLLGGKARRTAAGPTCDCDADSEPGIVLDPFIGSGTTAVAAEELVRDWCGVELNPEFAQLATRRIESARLKRGSRTTSRAGPIDSAA